MPQAQSLMEGLAALPCVGMDCVEVSPPFDPSETTAHAAAVLVWTWLCGQASQQAAG
jgi:agmatinase